MKNNSDTAKFAFLTHPLDIEDVESFEEGAKGRSLALVKKMLLWMCDDKAKSPFIGSHIVGIRSKTEQKAEGWFITIPLLPEQMLENPELAIKQIKKGINKAKELGASIVGLGAFTSVITNAGLKIAKETNIPLTSGNSYTVATAIEGIKKAAKPRYMGIKLSKAKIVIVGATGSIGRACSEMLAPEVAQLVLVARRQKPLENLAKKLENLTDVSISCDIKEALIDADIVITASSTAEAIIGLKDLEPGIIVCDIAQPADVSKSVSELRDDVLVFEGGIVRIPGLRIKRKSKYKYDFKLKPDRYAYACMSETMILCLEGIEEHFGLGGVKIYNVENISQLAEKHGFRLARTGFRSFGEKLTREQIREIRRNAAKKSNKRWFYRIRRRMDMNKERG